MSDHSDIEKLLRLKRYERPPEDFFQRFLETFHDRQRTEILTVSPWQLWRDRLSARWLEWRAVTSPRWVYAGAATCAAIILAAAYSLAPHGEGGLAGPGQAVKPAAPAVRPSIVEATGAKQVGPRNPARNPGVAPVSQESIPTEPNGLRRVPGGSVAPSTALPLVIPDDGAAPQPATDGGPRIILVR